MIAFDLDHTLLDTLVPMEAELARMGVRPDLRRYDLGNHEATTSALRRLSKRGWREPQLRPGALRILERLHLAGRPVALVSARPPGDWVATAEALKAQGVPLSGRERWADLALLGDENKVAYCLECQVTLLLDDHPVVLVEAFHRGLHAVAFDRPWNAGLPVQRLDRWRGPESVESLLVGLGWLDEVEERGKP